MIYLVGGDPVDGLAEVFDAFVASARKRGVRVGVALIGTPDDAGELLATHAGPITARWPQAEIVPIWLAGDETAWPDDAATLAGLVVGGGSASGCLSSLLPHRSDIARLVRSGSPYLGFSAGARIASEKAILGGVRHRGRVVAPEIAGDGLAELTIGQGLGLISVTVEAHTDAWCVIGVPIAAVETGLAHSAVAIDEATALAVDPVTGRCRVLGLGRVQWVTRESGHVMIRPEQAEAAPVHAGDAPHGDPHDPHGLHPLPHEPHPAGVRHPPRPVSGNPPSL